MEGLAVGFAMFAVFGLLGIGVLIAVIVGTVVSARNRPWRFDLGRVIGNLFTGIPYALIYGLAGVLPGAEEADPFGTTGELFGLPMTFALLFATIVVGLLLGTLGQLVMTRAALDGLEGEAVSTGAAVAAGVALVLPAIVMMILIVIAYMVGFVLLILPVLFLMAIWSVVLPVLVRERLGIFETMGRSAELTKGARWAILLLTLIMVVATAVLNGFAEGVAALVGGYPGLALSAAASAVFSTASPALAASIYHELRTQKEGAGGDELQSVFE